MPVKIVNTFEKLLRNFFWNGSSLDGACPILIGERQSFLLSWVDGVLATFEGGMKSFFQNGLGDSYMNLKPFGTRLS